VNYQAVEGAALDRQTLWALGRPDGTTMGGAERLVTSSQPAGPIGHASALDPIADLGKLDRHQQIVPTMPDSERSQVQYQVTTGPKWARERQGALPRRQFPCQLRA
jgi:hypothetical protein